jgi:hypothetical protein
VAQLHTQVLGSLFVASYDSQGYGGGIRTCLHTGIGFEILTVVLMKSYIFWDITTYSPLKVNRRFGGTSERVSKQRSAFSFIHAGFFLGLFFDSEDGEETFLSNVR